MDPVPGDDHTLRGVTGLERTDAQWVDAAYHQRSRWDYEMTPDRARRLCTANDVPYRSGQPMLPNFHSDYLEDQWAQQDARVTLEGNSDSVEWVVTNLTTGARLIFRRRTPAEAHVDAIKTWAELWKEDPSTRPAPSTPLVVDRVQRPRVTVQGVAGVVALIPALQALASLKDYELARCWGLHPTKFAEPLKALKEGRTAITTEQVKALGDAAAVDIVIE